MLDSITRIKDLMKEAEINKADLEKRCGLANGVIYKWEKKKQKPSADALIELAKYFGTSTDYLLGLTEERNGFKAVNVNNSAIAQGHYSTAVHGNNGSSKEEGELFRIFRLLDARGRHKLLSHAFELENSLDDKAVDKR